MNTYAVDFETYYDKEVSIRILGPKGYFSHHLFDAYLVTIVGDDGFQYVGCPKQFDWNILNGQRLLSHNASFDQSLYLHGVEAGWWNSCSPAEWHCTADMVAYFGLPRNLKDSSATVLGIEISKATRDNMSGKRWEDMTEEFRQEVLSYATKDSELCLQLWQKLSPEWPLFEQQVSALNRQICQNGLPVDEALIRNNAVALQQALFEAEQSIPWRDNGALLSPAQAKKACAAAGVEPPKSWAMGNEECEAWLDTYADKFPWVYAVRNYRRINSLLKKVQAFDRGTVNGRYYGGLLYFGAHTGRFSGSGGNLNLQNLPRGEMFGVDLRSQIKASPGHKLVVVDLSQIEVRTLCWLAGDHDTLAEIAATEDMYEAFAVRFGLWERGKPGFRSDGKLRSMVKQICLGAGYGASAAKFALISGMPLEEAEKCVALYQTRMQKVVELWKDYGRKIKMVKKGEDLVIPLPSGRGIRYKNVTSILTPDKKGSDRLFSQLVCERIINGKLRLVRPWFGQITENCSQALARDIFCAHLQKIHEAGHRIILHVHDEVVIEAPEHDAERTLEEVIEIMKTPPSWIPDIPLSAEGQIVTEYTK